MAPGSFPISVCGSTTPIFMYTSSRCGFQRLPGTMPAGSDSTCAYLREPVRSRSRPSRRDVAGRLASARSGTYMMTAGLGGGGARLGGRVMRGAMRAPYAVLAALLMLLPLAGGLTPAWVLVVAARAGLVRPNDLLMRNP